jgi:alpha-1,2-rhamnosyltransferase
MASPAMLLFGHFVKFRPGDTLVMVDSTWRSQSMLDALFKAQCNQGLIIGVMFHDLFPLTLPDTCEEITSKGFVSWFEQVVTRADFFVTNSESTRESLASYLAENRDVRPNPYVSNSFRLGAELDLVDSESRPSPSVQPLWDAPGRAMLCIGTIEPRKNHMYLLDVFDIMRDRGENVSLIILGRPGWKNEAILDRIRSHKDFGTRLLHLKDASDRDLEEAIERADCLVCPSIAEGFGLPVVEGLMHGLKVFASDIGVYREIGGENCSFFDLNDPLSLVSQLTDWFGFLQEGKLNEADDFSWPDWEESTREFLERTLDLAAQSQQNNFEFKVKKEI